MVLPADIDRLSAADLKSLILKLLDEVSGLRQTVAAQRDETARLKGGSGRPNMSKSDAHYRDIHCKTRTSVV